MVKTTDRPFKNVFAAMACISLCALAWSAPATAKMRWAAYKSQVLNLQVSVPADWMPVKIPNALAFRYEDLAGSTAAIGILKSGHASESIDQAADEEFKVEGSPADWQRSAARVGGMRAIKIIGLDPKNPDHKMVHYYVEAPLGTYLIQCQASKDRWVTFGPLFANILNKIIFFQ
jgi:hypothetical protein